LSWEGTLWNSIPKAFISSQRELVCRAISEGGVARQPAYNRSSRGQTRKMQARRLLDQRSTSRNACLPTRHFHLQRQKFWIISPVIHRRRTRWMASFTGGYSTRAFGTGRRKLPRRSHNSSNEVFSKRSLLRTAKYFTTSLPVISPLFSIGHNGPYP
jgi:hypothetical protein